MKTKRQRMKMDGFGRILAAILATGGMAIAQDTPQVAPAPPPATPENGEAVAEAAEEKPAMSLAPADQEFLRKAAELHATGLELAKLSEQNAATEETKALGQELLAEHTRGIAALRELARMKEMELEASPTATQQGIISELAGKEGSAFDTEYRSQAMSNHKQAVLLFASAAKSAKDEDARMLAERSLGEMKERHAALGGDDIKFTGAIAPGLPKPAKSLPKEKTGQTAKAEVKSKTPPSTAATAASAPETAGTAAAPSGTSAASAGSTAAAPDTNAVANPAATVPPSAPSSIGIIGADAGSAQAPETAISSATKRARDSATARREPASSRATRAASAPAVAPERAIESVENAGLAPDPDPRGRWSIPAAVATEEVRKPAGSRPAPPASTRTEGPDVEAIAAAPVARVVRRVKSTNQQPQVIERPPVQRRVIIRQAPRSFRLFDGRDDDDD